jgi:hypothetical protein
MFRPLRAELRLRITYICIICSYSILSTESVLLSPDHFYNLIPEYNPFLAYFRKVDFFHPHGFCVSMNLPLLIFKRWNQSL